MELIIKDDKVTNKDEMVQQTIKEFGEYLTDVDGDVEKALTAGDAVDDDGHDMSPAVRKALGLAETATEDDVLKALAKRDLELEIAKVGMDASELDFHNKLPESEQTAFRGMSKADRATKISKRDDIPEDIPQAPRGSRGREEATCCAWEKGCAGYFSKRAVDAGLPESDGELVFKAYAGDPAALDGLLERLKSANAAAKEGGVFKEFGASGASGPQNAVDELKAKAAELRKADPKLTPSQAFAKAYIDPANAKLAARERSENRPNLVVAS